MRGANAPVGRDTLLAPSATRPRHATGEPRRRLERRHRLGLDVVFPVLHGPYGEDGTVQGLLELANIAVCRPRRAGLGGRHGQGGDEDAVRGARPAGLPTGTASCAPDGIAIASGVLQQIARARPAGVRQAGQPRIERRHLEGEDARRSSCRRSSWRSSSIARWSSKPAVPNAREIECAVLGNDDPKTSVPGEIIPSREFYDYEAKYLDEGSQAVIPADLPAAISRGGAAAGDRGVPRDRCRRPGARRLPAGARQRRDLPQRDQHHARLHRPSACIRRCGKPAASRTARSSIG